MTLDDTWYEQLDIWSLIRNDSMSALDLMKALWIEHLILQIPSNSEYFHSFSLFQNSSMWYFHYYFPTLIFSTIKYEFPCNMPPSYPIVNNDAMYYNMYPVFDISKLLFFKRSVWFLISFSPNRISFIKIL